MGSCHSCCLASALGMHAFLLSAALTPLAATSGMHFLTRGLLSRVAMLICACMLTLVSRGFNNSLILHDALHNIGLPGAGVGWVLVQEVATRLGLLPV